MVRIYAGGMHPGSYTVYFLGMLVLAFLALILVGHLVALGESGYQLAVVGRVKEYCEEIWMAMAMDSGALARHVNDEV